LSKPTIEPLRLGHPTWKRRRGEKIRNTKRESKREQLITHGSHSILWELMEMEAPEKFYVNGKEHPAFLFFPRYHYLSAKKTKHSLYMNGVGLVSSFSSKKQTFARLREIVENANFPLRLYQVSKYGSKRGKRILFAENHTQRVDMTDAKGPMKVFNIEEWQKEAQG